MKIWFIHPGYLQLEELLREHASIQNILVDQALPAPDTTSKTVPLPASFLKIRQALVRSELAFRYSTWRSSTNNPVDLPEITFPSDFDRAVIRQLQQIGRSNKKGKGGRRIAVPQNVQQLWSQHKYSIMARDPEKYKAYGRQFARKTSHDAFKQAAPALTRMLYLAPPSGNLHNALQHMWGHVSQHSKGKGEDKDSAYPLIKRIQELCMENDASYVRNSTALTELRAWDTPSAEH